MAEASSSDRAKTKNEETKPKVLWEGFGGKITIGPATPEDMKILRDRVRQMGGEIR